MNKIELIRAELEKCYNECIKRAKITDPDYWNGKADAYRSVLDMLDNLTDVPVNEDLERASKFYNGAKWMKEKTIDKACEWLKTQDFVQEAFSDTNDIVVIFKRYMEE